MRMVWMWCGCVGVGLWVLLITGGGWCDMDDGFGSYYLDVCNKKKKRKLRLINMKLVFLDWLCNI